MKKNLFIFFLLIVSILPAYAQTQSNPTVSLESADVSFEKFNVISSNAIDGTFEREHAINWQLSIKNDIVYANPHGNAVIRLYDGIDREKFVEIGMGSPPDMKFWVAVKNPEVGYAVIHDRIKDGWDYNYEITVVYSDTAGLTVNNGQRIVVSNLDVEEYELKDFAVYGMESSTDPPAANSGSLILNVVSGNPSANPLFYLPYALAIGAAVLVVVLLKTKKRT